MIVDNAPLLPIEPPNPIHNYDEQLRARYPAMEGSTAWKASTEAEWQYHFAGIPDEQQAEVLAYARTLGEIP